MPNFERLAVCPFYEREAAQSVTCEGAYDGNIYTAVKFGNARDKKVWFKKFCAGFKYETCPYARMILSERYSEL